jgi:hypothetical protein
MSPSERRFRRRHILEARRAECRRRRAEDAIEPPAARVARRQATEALLDAMDRHGIGEGWISERLHNLAFAVQFRRATDLVERGVGADAALAGLLAVERYGLARELTITKAF